MTEQFANNASSTLNGTITSSQSTLVVASATPFPSVAQFRILVDSEIMLVTLVSGTTFTVSRGVENTVQASHNNGVAVTQILTAGAIAQSKTDAVTVRGLSAVKTAPYTLSNSDDFIPFSTSSGSFTINLPATPGTGEVHVLVDTAGSAASFPLSVSGNGNNINGTINGTGVTTIDTIGSNYGLVRYIFNGTAWNVIRNQNSTGNRVPPDANDLVVWQCTESTPPYANTGTVGTYNLVLNAGVNIPQSSGLVLPYSSGMGIAANGTLSTSTGSTTDNTVEPANITISCWINLVVFNTSGNVWHVVEKIYRPVSSGWSSPFDSIGLYINNANGALGTDLSISGTSGGGTATAISLGTWHHIGVTYDGTTQKLYANGVLVTSFTRGGAIDYGTHGPWICGQNPASGAEATFPGYIQDIRIANVVRPASWFRTVYRAGVGLSLP